MASMKRIRFSMFTLVVSLPILAAALVQIGSTLSGHSGRVRWSAFDEMPRAEEGHDGVLLVSYCSGADPATYYAHHWLNEHGGRVLRRHGIQAYVLDQQAASPEQRASLAQLFVDSAGCTGFGALDLSGDVPRSKWSNGVFHDEDDFERWIVGFIEDKKFGR